MRLRELDATFLRLEGDPAKAARYSSNEILGDKLEGAHGIMFLCPVCFTANKGKAGTHSVVCWFTGVSLDVAPGPGRWNPSGSGLDDLTFVGPGSVSVLLRGGCGWHGYVRGGDATLA